MKKDNGNHANSSQGRRGKLTILQTMGVLAVIGLLVTLVLHHYFG